MLLQLRLVRQYPIQATVQTRVVDLALLDPQQIIPRGGRVPALFDSQLTARRTPTVDGQHGGDAGPWQIGVVRIDRSLEEAVQLQALPKFQPQVADAELPCALQPHSVHQHARHLRIIGGRFDMRREQFQLLCFAVLVEHLHGLQPAGLRGTVQSPQITERLLTRTVGRAHRLHQRPVGMVFAVLGALVRPQKHSVAILS